MKHYSVACLFSLSFLLPLTPSCQSRKDFKWPNGAKAALCLTYDDALPSHVNTVGPMLKKYNFKATFYPTLSSPSIRNHMSKWKSLASEGHELGNHTVYHPCQKSEADMGWVKNYLDLDKYTTEQILAEIQVANSFLQSLDGKTIRTYAYPCAHFHAGGVSFKDSLSHYVTAARYSSEEQLELLIPTAIDLYAVPSWAPNNSTSNELISYIKKVVEKKTLSTFTFHGIGADHMVVSNKDHEEMLKYLDVHRAEIWVTTFQEATDYLRAMTK